MVSMSALADPGWLDIEQLTARAKAWAATMEGHRGSGTDRSSTPFRQAHAEEPNSLGARQPLLRKEREELETARLAPGATRALDAGHRATPEEPDPVRTCFERDRDRILHSSAYRRLAGKTQVFVFPTDHQRTRLTHALEVAQIARSIAKASRANESLAEAIALGHDCGHGPGGHASEDALAPFLEGGFDHAVWGADVTLVSLNLCLETLDGIRNHSWSRPVPATPEGEIVSWADRIAYVCHDFEDAAHVGIVNRADLPAVVRERCGTTRSSQLNAFVLGVVEAISATGQIGMTESTAEALVAFRQWNYQQIYLRPAARRQGEAVVSLLRALVTFFAERPHRLRVDVDPGSAEARHSAVSYVSGMTDRFACELAVAELGWDRSRLPQGIGLPSSA